MSKRWLFFCAYFLATLAVSWRPLLALARFALHDGNQSQVVLIPLISACLLVIERKRIFRSIEFGLLPGAIFFLAAAAAYGLPRLFLPRLSSSDALTVATLAVVLLWIAGFALLFGWPSLRAARFPLAFLLLTVPLPGFLLDRFIYWLQIGSALVTAVLFRCTGLPFRQEGLLFHLPHVTIEIASECSGIRSSLALLVLALLAGHLFLRTAWKKIAVIVCGIALMLVKNGVRIVTLSLLALYVDPGFLFGRLHSEGGGLFFLLALLLLTPFFLALRRPDDALVRPVHPE